MSPLAHEEADPLEARVTGLSIAATARPSREVSLKYQPGQLLADKYLLVGLLGEGGMGSIWLARNVVLDLEVAIKVIRGELTAELACERLLVEARAAASLGHPSIVRIYDYGQTAEGDPFLVMEVLQGESLAGLLDREVRVSASEAVQLLLPVASALSAAHARGIIHRDLKPENIMLAEDETGSTLPKIVDFGIAKLPRPEVGRCLTGAGDIVGTPGYLAPEQARGHEVDERADVWSFSVVLYELMTGVQPFGGTTTINQLAAILELTPVPTTERGAGDLALWEIIKKGLEKDVEARWPTMRSMGEALAAWAHSQGVEEDVAGRSISRQWSSQSWPRVVIPTPPRGPATVAAPAPKRARWPGALGLALLCFAMLGAARFGRGDVAAQARPIYSAVRAAWSQVPFPSGVAPSAQVATLPTATAVASASVAPSASTPPRAFPRAAPPRALGSGAGLLPIPSSPGF